ncbi:hypothetical protein [Nocardia xishanensis]|uniref:hypothetical protein n=1 Tax=Nocardia xishanensis TaxID=238964 RepID=UPI00082FFDB9|nr:hypothetical protein [Nocardia xishanensis]
MEVTISGGLECALCLYGAPRPRSIDDKAVTIVAGYALCEEHKWEFGDQAEARASELLVEHQERERERKRRRGEL